MLANLLGRGVQARAKICRSAGADVGFAVPAGDARGPALTGVIGANDVALSVRGDHITRAGPVAAAILESVVAVATLHTLMTSARGRVFLSPRSW